MNPKKNINQLQFSIIKELFYLQNATCNQISIQVKKSLPLVAKSINTLEDLGLIKDIGLAPSSGGRRPINYTLVSDKINLLLINSDQFSTTIGLYDLALNHVYPTHQFSIEIKTQNALDIILFEIKQYLIKYNISKKNILGVGYGMPGFVQANLGINHSYLIPKNNTLRDHLEQELELPVYIENDSRLLALAELKFNPNIKNKHTLVINLGWGIGLGMLINQELFTGSDGFAGEFSHIPLTDSKELCTCGKQGCLEVIASLTAIVNQATIAVENGKLTSLKQLKNIKSKSEMAELIFNEAYAGDQFTIELISEAAYSIGKAIAILIHIINPNGIILSGKSTSIIHLMQAPIQQALNKHCIPKLLNHIEINPSKLGYNAMHKGAAVLVMQNLTKEKLNKFIN